MAEKINDGLTPQDRYNKRNTVPVQLRFNKKTDADILKHLEGVENRQGYIKALIRADIARNIEPTTNE